MTRIASLDLLRDGQVPVLEEREGLPRHRVEVGGEEVRKIGIIPLEGVGGDGRSSPGQALHRVAGRLVDELFVDPDRQ
ncbi:MAG: hypothetical protein AB7S61_01590 [Methanoregulaceae archaeon]